MQKTLTKEELAAQLNGRSYGSEITLAECEVADESGLVVVVGYSDDGAVFHGAIHDEADAYDGGRIELTQAGIFQSECHDGTDCPYFRQLCRKQKVNVLKVFWCGKSQQEESPHWEKKGKPTWMFDFGNLRHSRCHRRLAVVSTLRQTAFGILNRLHPTKRSTITLFKTKIMAFPQYLSHEEIERRLESANQRRVPMLIKTKDGYRQVCRVRLTEAGFHGTLSNASPWDCDVVGTDLVFVHEQVRFDLSLPDDDDFAPGDIVQQCRKYVESLPPATAGQDGAKQTHHVANVIFHDFALDDTYAWIVLLEYNTRCHPCWGVAELRWFMNQAINNPPEDRPRGALRNKFIVETFDNER